MVKCRPTICKHADDTTACLITCFEVKTRLSEGSSWEIPVDDITTVQIRKISVMLLDRYGFCVLK